YGLRKPGAPIGLEFRLHFRSNSQAIEDCEEMDTTQPLLRMTNGFCRPHGALKGIWRTDIWLRFAFSPHDTQSFTAETNTEVSNDFTLLYQVIDCDRPKNGNVKWSASLDLSFRDGDHRKVCLNFVP